MEKIVSLAVDDVQKIDFDSYSDDEFAIAKMGFLSTRPNAHNLIIDEDVLRESASSALNKWVVADMFMGEPTTHTKNEHIVGRIPRSQSVEFVYDDDGYLRAYVDTVISKIYAKDFCKAFEQDKNRAVSVEMKIFTDGEDDNVVQRFNIMGVTVLGKSIKPSCPESDIEFVRFSEEDADKFFEKQSDSLSQLKNFVEERKQSMAEKKTYKIDKSKEAMSTADWGNYDKTAMRDKIMDAKNRDTLVKSVYLLVEDGWKDAPSEHLKYPVMMLDGDTFIYNRNALSSALAYAKQNDETEVVNKIKAIYKKLDLDDDSERKEEAKMEEIKELAATEVEAESTLEEKKEEMAEPEIEVKAEESNCDECDEHDHDDDKDDEHDEEMSADDMKARIAQLEKDIEDRDNIIMGQNSELETLRQFKKDVEDKEKAISVEAIMAECKEYMSDDCYKQMREEGMSCEFADVDAWANKVKAYCFSAVKKTPKKEKTDVFTFSAPVEKKEHKGLWD